jgi:YD repeat-containing protein
VCKRVAVGSLFLLMAHAFVSRPCAAQNQNPCMAYQIWYFPDTVPVGWSFVGPAQGLWSWIIGASLCPGPPESCSSTAPTCSGSKPIIFGSGDTIIDDRDVSIPGLGGGLTLKRTWHSVLPQMEPSTSVGIFGQGWRSTYEERIIFPPPSPSVNGLSPPIKYARSDGSYWQFVWNVTLSQWVSASPNNVMASLTSNLDYTQVFVTNKRTGEVRTFEKSDGLLTSIADRNGNTTQLTYDTSNRLVTVTSPAGQHLYFNYGTGASNYLVTSVTTDFGITLSYTYNSLGELVQVTKPDLTNLFYTYNAQSEITAVTDQLGKVLETHTYDSNGRGLTGSEANGVNALTVTYPTQ